MPIYYRCRCGQEVVLRPREGIYLVVAVLLGLTLLNTVLMLLLWFREPGSTGDLAARTPEKSAPAAPGAADARPSPAPPPPAAGELAKAGRNAPREDESVATTPLVAPSGAASSSNVPPSGPERKSRPGPPPIPPPPVADSAPAVHEESPTAVRLPTVSCELRRPATLDGLAIAALLEDLPNDPTAHALVLGAAAHWGVGSLRDDARRIAGGEQNRLARLLVSGDARRTDGAPAEDGVWKLDDRGAPASAALLKEVQEKWDPTWKELLGPREHPTASWQWVNDTRRLLAAPADFVVVVDLSESMKDETAASADVLRRLVPLTAGVSGERRWGWIGYRDDVVDRSPLTADLDEFLASLSRWKCEGGGDVPEGLDRALFDTLRVGGFEWGKKASRVLLVLGDTPPPYERIRGMISLAEEAHESPEGYVIRCLGIVRETMFDSVPAFRDLAHSTSGLSIFERPGAPLADAWWRLVCGSKEAVLEPPAGER